MVCPLTLCCPPLILGRHADIYTSRVSNFFRSTPYSYFRSPMQTLAHDRNLTKYSSLMAGPQPPNKPMRGELIDE